MSNIVPIKNQQASGSLTIKSMDDLARLSEMLCRSRFFEDCKDAAQAGVKVLCGLELGIPAFSAMSGIHIIKGKPVIGANIMAAMVKRSGKYNYRVLEHSEKVCKILFLEHAEHAGVSEVTMAEISAANIDKDWDRETKQYKLKHNWKTFPKNMLFARAISNGIRWYCPDLFLGAPVYTADELGADMDEDGSVIVVPVETVEPPKNDRSPLMADTSRLIKLLGWTKETGEAYLEQVYGKNNRKDLTDSELSEFKDYLELQVAIESSAIVDVEG